MSPRTGLLSPNMSDLRPGKHGQTSYLAVSRRSVVASSCRTGLSSLDGCGGSVDWNIARGFKHLMTH